MVKLRHLCGMRDDSLLTLHPTQRALGTTDAEYSHAYRALLTEAISQEDLAAIRAYLQQQPAYGRDGFRAMAEAKTRRFAGIRPAHRPEKNQPKTEQVNLTPFSEAGSTNKKGRQ